MLLSSNQVSTRRFKMPVNSPLNVSQLPNHERTPKVQWSASLKYPTQYLCVGSKSETEYSSYRLDDHLQTVNRARIFNHWIRYSKISRANNLLRGQSHAAS